MISLCVCLCIMCVPEAFKVQKRTQMPLELELHTVVSHCTGNQTEEQQLLFIAEPPFQPLDIVLKTYLYCFSHKFT